MLRGADFDWDNWAGLAPHELAAQRAAAVDTLKPSLAARALAVLRRRQRAASAKPAPDPGAAHVAAKANINGATGGAKEADSSVARNGGGSGSGANGSAMHGRTSASLPSGEGRAPEGQRWQANGEAAHSGSGSAGGATHGRAAGSGVEPAGRQGSGHVALAADGGGAPEHGSSRRLGSRTLDGSGELERGSRRNLGIGSRRSLDSGGRRADGPTLAGVRLAVPAGQLVGVCGEVGAGKSSLLAALLGELLPVRGAPGGGAAAAGAPWVRGRMAYCAQVPWIVSGTVRDNIVFGAPWDARRYARVVAACALEDDLAALPAGDGSELGERGLNLSGGQKARLALARAAYSWTDVALLDDPLSAVDPRVARVLFDECLGPAGVMAGRTRLLVTHQRQFLPACDRVVVLRAGRVFADGCFADLARLGLPELAGSEGGAAELDDAAYDAEVGGAGGRPAAPPQDVPARLRADADAGGGGAAADLPESGPAPLSPPSSVGGWERSAPRQVRPPRRQRASAAARLSGGPVRDLGLGRGPATGPARWRQSTRCRQQRERARKPWSSTAPAQPLCRPAPAAGRLPRRPPRSRRRARRARASRSPSACLTSPMTGPRLTGRSSGGRAAPPPPAPAARGRQAGRRPRRPSGAAARRWAAWTARASPARCRAARRPPAAARRTATGSGRVPRAACAARSARRSGA